MEEEKIIELTDEVVEPLEQEKTTGTTNVIESAEEDTIESAEFEEKEEIIEFEPESSELTDSLGMDLDLKIDSTDNPAEELSLLPEGIEKAIEHVIEKKFSGKIEKMLAEIIEKAVLREIENIKGKLLD